MEDSIFTKIINGDIPCHKVYEDDRVFAFLDIHPIQPGHTLVVPKKQIDQFDELSEEDYEALFGAVKVIAQKQKAVLGKPRACVRVEGFDVPHAHVHVYPCNDAREFYGDPDRAQKEPDHDALAEVAQKLAL
ncbi:MAG: HIT family protein [Candidatus Saccharibacteria bacterium]|nr:HIT family protein [Candidatus Saccharibacteria bacterium]